MEPSLAAVVVSAMKPFALIIALFVLAGATYVAVAMPGDAEITAIHHHR